MSEIVRIIALAIVTFLVTAVILILSNPDLSRMAAELAGVEAPQEWGGDGSEGLAALKPGDEVFAVPRPYRNRWLGLMGFPSTAEIRFPVPRDLPVTGGQLQLVLDSRMIDAGDGLVTVTINGVQRDAVVLDPGLFTHHLLYGLTAGDLAGKEVVVGLSGNGTTNHGQICPTNVTNLGAAVELDEESALLLRLDAPAASDEAQLVVAAGPLALAPRGPDTAPAMPVWAAQHLSRMNVASELTPEGMAGFVIGPDGEALVGRDHNGLFHIAGIEGVRHVAELRGGALPPVYAQDWPVEVSALGADLMAGSFRGSRRWAIDYKLADMPEGIAPDRLDLHFATSILQEPIDWVLRVTLNGNLIHTSSHDGRAESITQSVTLPPDLQQFRNSIGVTLIDNSPNQGICRAGPDAAAQLLPATVLAYDDPAPANPREAVVRALAAAASVSLHAPPDLAVSPALRASGLLEMVLPLTAGMQFGDTPGTNSIRVLNGQALAAMDPGDLTRGYLVIPEFQDDAVDVIDLSVETGRGGIALGSDGAALLVQ